MASFTTAQLATLPHDVLLQHLLPMLANSTETHQQRSDRIAQECTNWTSTYWNERTADLPGFIPMGQVYHATHVYDVPFNAFCVFGAKEDVPFSVWRSLAHNDECDCEPIVEYARIMYYRRVQQRQAEWRDRPAPPAQMYGLIAAEAEMNDRDHRDEVGLW